MHAPVWPVGIYDKMEVSYQYMISLFGNEIPYVDCANKIYISPFQPIIADKFVTSRWLFKTSDEKFCNIRGARDWADG